MKNKWTIAQKQVYNNHRYDSRFEAKEAMDLDLLKRANEIKDWETQVSLDLICNGYKVGTYRMDFVVYHNDGSVELRETKGLATQLWKYKWKILETMVKNRLEYLMDKFGDNEIKMTLIKQRDNWSMHKIKKV